MNGEHGGLLEILLVVLVSSLFSIGGGAGPIAVIQDRWVSPGVLEASLFAWAIALGHLSPGPKAGFLAGVGYYMAGIPGAIAAIIGIAMPTTVGAAAVSYWYAKLRPVINWIRLPAGFVVAGLITAAAWGLAAPLDLNAVEIGAVGVVAVLIGWRNLEPAIVIIGAALIGLLWGLLAT